MLTTSRLVPLVFHMLPHLLLSSVHSPICALVCLLSYLCFHLCAPAFLPRDAMFHLFLFTLFGVPCRCNFVTFFELKSRKNNKRPFAHWLSRGYAHILSLSLPQSFSQSFTAYFFTSVSLSSTFIVKYISVLFSFHSLLLLFTSLTCGFIRSFYSYFNS